MILLIMNFFIKALAPVYFDKNLPIDALVGSEKWILFNFDTFLLNLLS